MSPFSRAADCRRITFGEAAWAAQPVLSWQTTVVGDPLYRPFAKEPAGVARGIPRAPTTADRMVSYAAIVDLGPCSRCARCPTRRPSSKPFRNHQQRRAHRKTRRLLSNQGQTVLGPLKPTSASYLKPVTGTAHSHPAHAGPKNFWRRTAKPMPLKTTNSFSRKPPIIPANRTSRQTGCARTKIHDDQRSGQAVAFPHDRTSNSNEDQRRAIRCSAFDVCSRDAELDFRCSQIIPAT